MQALAVIQTNVEPQLVLMPPPLQWERELDSEPLLDQVLRTLSSMSAPVSNLTLEDEKGHERLPVMIEQHLQHRGKRTGGRTTAPPKGALHSGAAPDRFRSEVSDPIAADMKCREDYGIAMDGVSQEGGPGASMSLAPQVSSIAAGATLTGETPRDGADRNAIIRHTGIFARKRKRDIIRGQSHGSYPHKRLAQEAGDAELTYFLQQRPRGPLAGSSGCAEENGDGVGRGTEQSLESSEDSSLNEDDSFDGVTNTGGSHTKVPSRTILILFTCVIIHS